MNQPMRLSPDSLLAHEPFVRAVVRELLKDEHRVQDVLQETWIRALHKGPSEGGSLKGWLASVARRLALDEHRGSARRERRERETARGEALESVDALHARLEAQREVVDAVLALEEPYKSVVLLAYYEQLSADAIGKRLGRSAATVRSQLSRAHEVLKRRLDHEHGGDRSAWAGVLLPWALATKSKAGLLAAAGIGAALIGAGVWGLPRVFSQRAATSRSVALELSSEPATTPTPIASSVSSNEREPVAAAPTALPTTRAAKPDLEKLGASELRDLAVQAMRTLEKKLLTPEARFFEQEKALLALPGTGLTKLLARREDGSFPYEGLILTRSGGSHFSFATLSHDYDREPEVGYSVGGQLSSCFYGLMLGVICPIGSVALESLSPDQRVGCDDLYVRPRAFDEDTLRPLQQEFQQRMVSYATAQAGVTYLVRSLSPGEHDELVGMRVLDVSDDEVTIAWRVLQRFPTPGEKRSPYRKPAFVEVADAPVWVQELQPAALVELIREIRTAARRVLPGVPEPLRQENQWRLAGTALSGFFRIHHSDTLAPVLDVYEGLVRYSCDQREYPGEDWELGVRDGAVHGLLQFDLGELDRTEYDQATRGELPLELASNPRVSVNYQRPGATRALWHAAISAGADGRPAVSPEDEHLCRDSHVQSDVLSRTGHSYLVRALGRSDQSDHLLLLTVLETSDASTSFSWRELKRFDR